MIGLILSLAIIDDVTIGLSVDNTGGGPPPDGNGFGLLKRSF